MNPTWQCISAYLHNPLVWIFAVYWLFSAVTSRMPTPKEGDSKRYVIAYGVMHSISGSIARLAPILAPKFPILALLLGWSDPAQQKVDNPIAADKSNAAASSGS